MLPVDLNRSTDFSPDVLAIPVSVIVFLDLSRPIRTC
jgi:hypothetical protein